ncbi:Integrase core domain-containing protein [Micromonospora rhizosphaerae]|uniref:Integrase core domain-containing protein n=1 Tax=Micromonospora rhizosphaerae TaxID=568872 RepID=A0A1C6SP66_9ACTN|nr:IS3 family transposase [Micromonospora rhizosphaerae]SCL31079.1 Integrase core domain-containing protein [Micromonospora rhizosphaerae]
MTSRFRFISAHRAVFGVKRLCRVLAVSRSGFYRWAASEPARQDRVAAEDALAEQIRIIHADSGGTYGSPRVTVELHDQGVRVNRKRVERIMRQRDVVGRHLRRRKRTTIADPAAPPAPDLIGRDFTATAPDQRWCGDITYLRVGGGWLYLATVIDIATRRLIGWSINTHMRTSLVIDALNAAVAARGGQVDGVIFHSDRGAQGGFNWSSQHLVGEVKRWRMGWGRSGFGSIGVRFLRRDGRRWRGVRTGSGSGLRSVAV